MSELRGKNCVVDFLEATNRLRSNRAATTNKAPSRRRKGSVRRPTNRESQHIESDYIDEVIRFRCALLNLAQNNSDPADIIRYMDPLFGDVPLIREHLDHAVRWINRFAQEWNREQTTHGSPGKVQQSFE
jgi:hypothetical protein